MADYAYTMGVLRSLERRLLNPTDLERMVDAPDATAAFRVFGDTDYADNMLEVSPSEFKKALDADFKQTRDLYEQMVPEKGLFEFLFLRYDYHNIKLAFKAKYSGKDLSEYASNLGLVEAEKVRKYITGEAEVSLPETLRKVIDEVSALFEQNQDPHFIDSELDSRMFARLKDVADALGNKFVSDFLSLQIDLANLKILLRVKRMGREVSFLKNELLPGGGRDTADLVSLFELDTKTMVKALEKYFDNELKVVLDEYESSEDLWKLEQGLENYELAWLKKTKRFSYGPELVVAYYYAKKNAIRNVRLVMTGKLNGVESQEIRQRIKSLW